MARVNGIAQFYLPPNTFIQVLNEPSSLYLSAAEYHCTLASTHFSPAYSRRLSWLKLF